MYLLDTNVVSELRKAHAGRADENVARWARGVEASALYVSAITIMELDVGAHLAARRDSAQGALLQRWIEEHVLAAFVERVLPVDLAVARICAKLHVPDRRPDRDALIAATALAHGMTVVTRNVADFERIGARLLNPWAPA